MRKGWLSRSGASSIQGVGGHEFSPHPSSPSLLAFREGGVAGVEGGLAPKARCPSPSGAPDGVGDGWSRCACVCVEQTCDKAEDLKED